MSSREYYRSSSSRDALPPIRDVLGDQLDFPPHRQNAYSFDAVNRALPDAPNSRSRSTWPQSTGPTLPPIHHSRSQGYATATPPTPTYTSHSHHTHAASRTAHTHSPSSRQPQHSSSHASAPAPAYSFDVFRPSSSGLVHASSSSRSQGILRSTRADAGRRHGGGAAQPSDDDRDEDREREGERDESSKKYICGRCRKRFGRPSSLKTHEVVHSDEKPFTCTHPGCLKTFTVASNMRRHFRNMHETHGESAEWEEVEEEYSASGSGSGGRGYYTSSRR